MNKHLTVIIVAGLALAGCGGEDDEGLSKAEFLKQGNAICKKQNDAIDAAGRAFGEGEPTKAELTSFAKETLVPEVQNAIDTLRALAPPDDDKAKIKAFIDDAQAALGKIEAEPSVITGDADPFGEVNQRAKAYGLTACAE